MVWRLGIMASFAGFLAIGFLLATGHPGFAIKFTNYLYFLLLVSVFASLATNGKKR